MKSSQIRRVTRASYSQQGMTLVEIMVVIAILGTLMSVIAFSVVSSLDRANCSTTKLTMGNADQALQLYTVKKKGKFPSTSEGLEAAERYFNDGVPKDAWGNELQYFSPGSHSDAKYELVSLGKDGVEGGDDADADIQSWDMDEACDF